MKLILFLFVFCNFSICLSQDILIKVSGDSIEANIIKVSNDKISFKKFSNLEGPEYEVLTSSVYKILFQNGHEEIFNIKAVERNEIIKNPEDAIKKGNNFFITSFDITSEKAEKYLIENIKYLDYWNLVDDKNLAHFVLELTIEKRGLGFFRGWVTFKTIDGLEFKKSEYFKASVNAFNGYNPGKELCEKIVEDYLKVKFR